MRKSSSVLLSWKCISLVTTALVPHLSRADGFVLAPTPGITYTSSVIPFLSKQVGYTSMRYQQVYNASSFTNIDPDLIYITTMKFYLYPNGRGGIPWIITNLQVNLSTTSRSADTLSSTFAQNIGPDDTIVFGPGRYNFPGGGAGAEQQLLFTVPFRYRPQNGNLLLDVRVFNGLGPFDALLPTLGAYSSSTDQCSRVWAPDVSATVATVVDSTSLFTTIQMSPVPSITAQFYPLYAGSLTNEIVISWPSQPTIFKLQQGYLIGSNLSWHAATNQLNGDPVSGGWFIKIPAAGAASNSFFRLVWSNGVGPVTSSQSRSLSAPVENPDWHQPADRAFNFPRK